MERAREQGERSAYSFLDAAGEIARTMTYADLDRQARALGSLLTARTSENARVLLVFEPGLDFIVAFFACAYSGRVAVPMAAPRLRGAACDRLLGAWQNAGAEAVLSHGSVLSRSAWRDIGIPEQLCIDVDQQRSLMNEEVALIGDGRSDYAFIQYTSGSTSEPKGVVVTYDSLSDNLGHIQRRFGSRPDTRAVGWLPMYHDMGLVSSMLHPLHTGFHGILMSPLDFVQRPVRWLRAVQRYQAEASGGPTFGYEHCVERITLAQCEGLDLSTWRVAFVGAEAVRADVLDAFVERFGPYGFRRSSFFPCYGMAEATLMVSGAIKHDGPREMHVDGEALARGRVQRQELNGRRLIGCGEPIDGHLVRVVDPATGEVCPDGVVGELWVSGPSMAAGYWNAPELTEQTFQAKLAGEPGTFMRTGDAGCLVDNQLFITTRLKTQIKIRGRSLAPEDIEAAAQAASSQLVQHGGAAFSIADDARERLVLVQEIRRECLRDVKLKPLSLAVVEAIGIGFGVSAEVLFVTPGAVPRTTSGKIQRVKTRELYLKGELAKCRVLGSASAPAAEIMEAAS
jgi:acyl-CoA synthetase (AMP-forming)/AMP-acid ligase II